MGLRPVPGDRAWRPVPGDRAWRPVPGDRGLRPAPGDEENGMTIPALAVLLVDLAMGWMTVGLVFGLAFLTLGIDRIDPAARGALAVRPLLLPGLALLWPLAAWRWWVLARARAGAARREPG
jgi:hypothetical protein